MIEAGAVPLFIDMLSSPDRDVMDQAIWGLGNIAGDSTQSRDYVLELNALEAVIALFHREVSTVGGVSLLRNLTWAISNFCRGKPQPNFQRVRSVLPILATLLSHDDVEILTDACWALSYLSDGENDRIQAVIDVGICPRLIELLSHQTEAIQVPALRTVGNIVTGDDSQTQTLLNLNVVARLGELLNLSERRAIKKETCWAISNITAGNVEQIQTVIAVHHSFINFITAFFAFTSQNSPRLICSALLGWFDPSLGPSIGGQRLYREEGGCMGYREWYCWGFG